MSHFKCFSYYFAKSDINLSCLILVYEIYEYPCERSELHRPNKQDKCNSLERGKNHIYKDDQLNLDQFCEYDTVLPSLSFLIIIQMCRNNEIFVCVE